MVECPQCRTNKPRLVGTKRQFRGQPSRTCTLNHTGQRQDGSGGHRGVVRLKLVREGIQLDVSRAREIRQGEVKLVKEQCSSGLLGV